MSPVVYVLLIGSAFGFRKSSGDFETKSDRRWCDDFRVKFQVEDAVKDESVGADEKVFCTQREPGYQ